MKLRENLIEKTNLFEKNLTEAESPKIILKKSC